MQIRPSRTFSFGDFVGQLPPGVVLDAVGPIVDVLDASAIVPTVKAEPMSLAAKQALYADHDVPAHRFAFKEATQILANVGPAGGPSVADLGLATEDVGALSAAIGQTDGDTSYEELGCIGLEPEAGYLDGVITIKRPVGYGGPLCGAGSTEYVAFWIDFGSDVLLDWPTSVAMEGTWDLRITAQDPATSTLFPGSQLLRVRIDNTAPSGPAGPLATIEQNEALPRPYDRRACGRL